MAIRFAAPAGLIAAWRPLPAGGIAQGVITLAR